MTLKHPHNFANNWDDLLQPIFSALLRSSLALTRGQGSLSVTRASIATVWAYPPAAVSGDPLVLITVASGEARFTGARRISEGVWSNTFADGTPIPASTLKGALIEDSRTNLNIYSEQYDIANWAKNEATVTANAVVAPTGTSIADKIIPSVVNTSHYVTIGATVGVGSNYVYSAYARPDGYDSLTFQFGGAGQTVQENALYTLSGTGTATDGAPAPTSKGIKAYDNSWYRANMVAPWEATTASPISIVGNAGSYSFAGDGTSGIDLFGAQLELGNFPSSYIPTPTNATVSRNADVISAQTSGNINSTRGSIVLAFSMAYAPISPNTYILWGSRVDANNYTRITLTTTFLTFLKVVGGVSYSAAISSAGVTADSIHKVAAKWDDVNGTQIFLNGVAGTPNANTAAVQLASTMEIGSSGAGATQAFASIKDVKIYSSARGDSNLIQLTA